LRFPGVPRQKGFTLWELLVVVAIVAVTVSMLQLSVSLGDEHRELKRLGKDLGKLFQLLSQEAVFENRNYAVSVYDEGFVILELREGKWLETGENFLKKFKMRESQHSRLYLEDKLVDTERKAEPPPHILILSSGEMTPFEWRIVDNQTNAGIVLQGNLLGSVLMTGPEPLS
jgi:general secretion pathway protein H